MKKPLLVFIFFAVLLLLTQYAYSRYCASRPEGCEKVEHTTDDTGPQEGIDW